jgi:hypothetical protein
MKAIDLEIINPKSNSSLSKHESYVQAWQTHRATCHPLTVGSAVTTIEGTGRMLSLTRGMNTAGGLPDVTN